MTALQKHGLGRGVQIVEVRKKHKSVLRVYQCNERLDQIYHYYCFSAVLHIQLRRDSFHSLLIILL